MKKPSTYLFALVLIAVAGTLLFGRFGSGTRHQIASPGGAVTVLTAPAREESWADQVEALGTGRANEAVAITANVSGKVDAVHFEDDQSVDAGQLLVQLDARLQRARLQEARVNLQEDERLLRYYSKLESTQAVSRTLLDEQQAKVDASRARLAAAEAELEDFAIRAPFAGMLGTRQVSPGSLVAPGTVVTTLDDIEPLRLDFTVPERWLSQLRAGQVVEATSVAWPGRKFAGVVQSIGSRVDPVTRSARVRAELENRERLLRPGMLLTLTLFTEARKAVTVPEMAILKQAEQNFVYVVDDGNLATRRPVQLGRRRQGRVEILDGLATGEQVVTEGTQKMQPGVEVIIADGQQPAAVK